MSGPDTASRTYLLAFSAVCTFGIINMCTEIRHRNGPRRTVLLTFFAADTACLTGFCHSLSFCMRSAEYSCLLLIRHKLNQMSRTFLHTFSARLTCFPVHNRNAVHNVNGIKGTRLYAASKSKTPVCTCLCSAAWHKRHHLAVLHVSTTSCPMISAITFAAASPPTGQPFTGASPFAMAAARPSQPG